MSSDVPTQPADPLARPADEATRVAVTAVMSAWAMAGVRTGIQAGWAALAVWAVREVPWLPLPHDPPGWLSVAGGVLAVAAVTAGIRWLEARSRGTWWGRVGAWAGRALMLGIVQQPTYSARGKGVASRTVT